MRKHLHYILAFLLFCFYTVAYQDTLSHVIYYHEQHHLFLFTKAYLVYQLHFEGVLSYLTAFLIQFFYYPLLGSCLLAGLLTSIYLMLRFNIRRITGLTDVLQLSLLPSLVLFLYTMSVEHSLMPVVSVWLVLAALSLVNCFAGNRLWGWLRLRLTFRPLGNRQFWILSVVCILVYAGGTFHWFVNHYSMQEYRMLKAEKAVSDKDWDEVLQQTDRYMRRFGQNNQLIYYFRNLALYHKGELIDRLLEYPSPLGVKMLYLPWNSDSRESEYGHFLYEDLGYINEAQRWEFESMVVWGETAPHLINLARYNIVNKRPEVARRFINILKGSLFYKKEAERLEQQLYRGSIPGLRAPLRDVRETPANFINVSNIGPNLQYLCEKDPGNRMAFEYLMCDLLLSNHLERFIQNLKFYPRYHYERMPELFNEALLIYELGVGEKTFKSVGIPVSDAIRRRFDRYYTLVKEKNMPALEAEFGQTYWYYLNFISPYGNKVIR